MNTSNKGIIEIISHEAIVTSPYKDQKGIWTVGIGHTKYAGMPDPEKNKREFSISEIKTIFKKDIKKFEERVTKAFGKKLTQKQFDAAVSFDFNTGGINKAKWVKHFNDGDTKNAKIAFMKWNKPKSIIRRRKKEFNLFFNAQYSENPTVIAYPATINGNVMWEKGKKINPKNITQQKGGNINLKIIASVITAITAIIAAKWEKINQWMEKIIW